MVAGFPPAIAAHAAIGTPVPNGELPVLGASGSQKVLGDAPARVLVFFRPDQGRSTLALKELASCRKELSGRPARWVGLVPEGSPPASVAAMAAEAGIDFPVLLDKADAFYAALGLSLHPVVAIVDAERRLAAFEPFRSVDFCAVVTAQLRYALREIDAKELGLALSPPPATQPSASGGKRYRSLAEALLRAGNAPRAIENARRAVELGPDDADSHAVLGKALAANADCVAARIAFARAQALDASHAGARAGLEACAGRP